MKRQCFAGCQSHSRSGKEHTRSYTLVGMVASDGSGEDSHSLGDAQPLQPALLLGLSLKAKVHQSSESGGEVLEEGLLLLGIQLNILPELGVPDKSHVSGQHHQVTGGVLVLLGALPLLDRPLVRQKLTEVLVGEGGLGTSPGAGVARGIGVAAAQGVCADQSNDLTVVEAHAVEDIPHVLDGLLLAALVSVRQATVRGAEVAIGLVSAAGVEGNGRATHLLNGYNAGQDPEISMRDFRVGLLNGLEEVTGYTKAGICGVLALGAEAHGGSVAATGLGGGIPGAGGVPGQTDQGGAHVCVFTQSVSNLLLDLAIVGGGRLGMGVLVVAHAGGSS
eukprot:comp19321_c0_seq1/m.22202 comp19321_c0_seq1/g.22202  ORF comp19321_c0_seq1/g.22202 comp19321_c0_seq1/m.22202 type:complete len:334 (+) comp19321_c0_seq1:380-1381(+)